MSKVNQIILFLFITILFACNDDNEPSVCQLTNVNISYGPSDPNNYNQTYVYEKGKLTTVNDQNGNFTKFNYDQNDLIALIEYGSGTTEISYGPDNRPSIVKYKQQSTTLGTEVFTWGENSLRITHTHEGQTSPVAIKNFEFANNNIIKHTLTVYKHDNLSELLMIEESTYSDYDEKLNPYYLSSEVWHRYPDPISKNNYKSGVFKQTWYSNGIAQPTQTSGATYSYIYNSSNAVTEMTEIGASGTKVTSFIYSCN